MAYSFSQLEQLWKQAGGNPASAPIAAAIALAESTGNPSALNNDPNTGDYSVGLWQVNYFGSLYQSRTAQFGPPAQLTNPLANAKAAVAISDNGTNFSPWSTYKSGAYQSYLSGGGAASPSSLTQAPPRPSGNATLDLSVGGALGDIGGFVGDLPVIGGIVQGASAATDAVKMFVWLLSPKHWAMMFEAVVGVVLMLLGFKYFATGSSNVNIKIPGTDEEPSRREYSKAYGQGRKQGLTAAARREGRRSVAVASSAAKTAEPAVLFAE